MAVHTWRTPQDPSVYAVVDMPVTGALAYIDRVREATKRPAAALVVGTKPYRPEEVASHLDLPLAGALAWDPRGAGTLWAAGVSRGWTRTLLARSAAQVWANLFDIASPPPSALPAGPPQGQPQAHG